MSNHLYKFNFVLDEKFQQYKVPRATFSVDLRNQFYSYMNPFAAEILSTMESDRTSLGTLDMWINFYTVGDFNEIHCTNSEEYVQRCNYTGILILELDNNEILTVYDEQNSGQ